MATNSTVEAAQKYCSRTGELFGKKSDTPVPMKKSLQEMSSDKQLYSLIACTDSKTGLIDSVAFLNGRAGGKVPQDTVRIDLGDKTSTKCVTTNFAWTEMVTQMAFYYTDTAVEGISFRKTGSSAAIKVGKTSSTKNKVVTFTKDDRF